METNELLQAMKTMLQEELKPINARLGRLESGQERLEQKVDGLEQKVDGLEAGQAKLEAGQKTMQLTVDRLEFLMEHKLPEQMSLLSEGHEGLYSRLPDVNAVFDLKQRVGALETTVTQNTDDIRDLKAM